MSCGRHYARMTFDAWPFAAFRLLFFSLALKSGNNSRNGDENNKHAHHQQTNRIHIYLLVHFRHGGYFNDIRS